MIRFLRLLLGRSSPFCLRWGHDYYQAWGPWNPGCAYNYACADPDCGWTGMEKN